MNTKLRTMCALAAACATTPPDPEREKVGLRTMLTGLFRKGLAQAGSETFADGFAFESGEKRYSRSDLASLDWSVFPRVEMRLIVRKSEVSGETASFGGFVTPLDLARQVAGTYFYAACRVDLERRAGSWKLRRVALRPLTEYQYVYRLPSNYDASKKYPLIVYLHGAHLCGDNLKMVEVESEFRFTKLTDRLDRFIIGLPQCPAETIWMPPLVMATIEKMKTDHAIDEERIYLMGNSLGGAGVWSTVLACPRSFAAAVPICGPVYSTDDMAAIVGLPIWVFHGKLDPSVPFGHSRAMVDRLKALGSATVRFTAYEDEGHDIATKVTDTAELYDWLLAHKRKP